MEISVQPVPAGHPYTRSVTTPAPPDVRMLPDPVVDPAEPGRWWPHPALEPEFHRLHDVDVLHVHFGFEHLGAQRTGHLLRTLAEKDVRVVLTVHDLDNPHLADQEEFHRQLALLIPAADHLITLSSAAAERIRARHGRVAEVIAHPPIVDPGEHPAARPGEIPDWSDRTPSAGVFLKSLRTNVIVDPGFYRALAAEVYLHDDVAADPDLGDMVTHRHRPMADDELFDAVARHRVVVLPYARGTHSGWLRMCRDLGTSVAVPDCGCYAGGLETFCGLLVRGLRARGHTVDLYAARGSEGHRRDLEFPGVDWSGSGLTPTDHTLPPGQRELDDAAFRRLRAHLEVSDYDVVHNNSLHPELLRSTTLPLVTTLHCPVVPDMAEAMAGTTSVLTAVSRAVTSTWDLPAEPLIIPNCVDEETWTYGPGAGEPCGSGA